MKNRYLFLILLCALIQNTTSFADIYIANSGRETGEGSVVVFDNNADGSTAPIRTISGAATTLKFPSGIYIHKGELYVADKINRNILVFLESDDGDVTPQRVISFTDNTDLEIEGMTIYNDEIFIAADGTGHNAIYVFDANLTGPITPERIIQDVNSPAGIDISNDEIFVASYLDDSINVYNLNDNGNISPKRRIVGISTELDRPYGVEINNEQIYAFDFNSVRVFPIAGDGNIPPTRGIIGNITTLSDGFLDDSFISNNLLYIANYNHDSISIFNKDASGNVSPARNIIGLNTTLNGPYDIFVTPDTLNPALIMYLLN